MNTIERFRGCLIGLAVGDAFGAQLLRAGDPVHAPIALEPPLRWGGFAHLATWVSRGLLVALEEGSSDALVVSGVGRALIRWRTDPKAAATRRDPGTLAAVGRLIEGQPWSSSGQPSGEPAAVAVRALPLGLVFRPSGVARPVAATTRLTHTHPTAVESAFFAAWLVSRLVRGAHVGPALIEDGRSVVEGLELGGTLPQSLADALAAAHEHAGRPLQHLRAAEIWPGDGGARAESAVAIAVLALILGARVAPAERFEVVVELAARVSGDAEATAALAGALAGAAWGLPIVPRTLVEPLEGLEVLAGLADALYDEAYGLPMEASAAPPEPAPAPHQDWAPPPADDATDLEWEVHELLAAAEKHAAEREPPAAAAAPASAETKWVYEGEVDREAVLDAWKRHHTQG